MPDARPPTPDTAPLVLDEREVAEMLRLPADADLLAHLCQRRKLPCAVIKHDGRTLRRFATEDVLKWLRTEAARRNEKTPPP